MAAKPEQQVGLGCDRLGDIAAWNRPCRAPGDTILSDRKHHHRTLVIFNQAAGHQAQYSSRPPRMGEDQRSHFTQPGISLELGSGGLVNLVG